MLNMRACENVDRRRYKTTNSSDQRTMLYESPKISKKSHICSVKLDRGNKAVRLSELLPTWVAHKPTEEHHLKYIINTTEK